jgi:hypothetical protein
MRRGNRQPGGSRDCCRRWRSLAALPPGCTERHGRHRSPRCPPTGVEAKRTLPLLIIKLARRPVTPPRIAGTGARGLRSHRQHNTQSDGLRPWPARRHRPAARQLGDGELVKTAATTCWASFFLSLKSRVDVAHVREQPPQHRGIRPPPAAPRTAAGGGDFARAPVAAASSFPRPGTGRPLLQPLPGKPRHKAAERPRLPDSAALPRFPVPAIRPFAARGTPCAHRLEPPGMACGHARQNLPALVLGGCRVTGKSG